MKKINLVIFSGSKKSILFKAIEKELIIIANNLDKGKYNVWYGGGPGLMPIIPYNFYKNGGSVYSVDAKLFVDMRGVASFGTTYVMDTFNERQNNLLSKGDIFLVLPGGVGTMSELFDALVDNDVNKRNTKILIYSYNNFYKGILTFINDKISLGFINKNILNNLYFFEDSIDIINFFDKFTPVTTPSGNKVDVVDTVVPKQQKTGKVTKTKTKAKKKKNLVIFSGSKKSIFFKEISKELINIANNLDKDKYNVWYGGGESGLMRIIPYNFDKNGGSVYSVDAKQFVDIYGVASFGTTYVMDTFNERQNNLLSKGDIFLVLPGGVGTTSELFDALVNISISIKSGKKRDTKILIYSYNNFYKDILTFINDKISLGFINKNVLNNLLFFEDSDEIINFFDKFTPVTTPPEKKENKLKKKQGKKKKKKKTIKKKTKGGKKRKNQEAIHNKLTEKETTVVLNEMLSWSGNSFNVLDEKSNVLYNIKGKILTLRDTMTIYDAKNKKVAVVYQKIFSLRTTFQIFRYIPISSEQESKEKDSDNVPLYRFARITKYMLSFPKYVYQLYNANNKKDNKKIMTMNRNFSLKKNYNIKDFNNQIICKINQTSLIQFKEANTYNVTVSPNADLLGCIILAIVADNVSDKNN